MKLRRDEELNRRSRRKEAHFSFGTWNLELGFSKWSLLTSAATLMIASTVFAAQEPPTDWIDPDTGHRVIRLSTEPGSESLYFTQNSFTPKGDKFIFDSPRIGV